MITKAQLVSLYGRWVRQDPYTDKALAHAARAIYPKVVSECTYEWRGKRRWMGGADNIAKTIQGVFQTFVEEYERGGVKFSTFDAVIWVVHHNGVLADKFISDCHTEEEAIEFLDILGGIKRSS